MMKPLLLDIINKLHGCGFDVVATVSDTSPTNIGIWKALDVSIMCTFFKHPNTNNNVNVFVDVPHLLKLARSHFIDNGFVLKDEKYIGKT